MILMYIILGETIFSLQLYPNKAEKKIMEGREVKTSDFII